jgi:hypothetical protein
MNERVRQVNKNPASKIPPLSTEGYILPAPFSCFWVDAMLKISPTRPTFVLVFQFRASFLDLLKHQSLDQHEGRPHVIHFDEAILIVAPNLFAVMGQQL